MLGDVVDIMDNFDCGTSILPFLLSHNIPWLYQHFHINSYQHFLSIVPIGFPKLNKKLPDGLIINTIMACNKITANSQCVSGNQLDILLLAVADKLSLRKYQ